LTVVAENNKQQIILVLPKSSVKKDRGFFVSKMKAKKKTATATDSGEGRNPVLSGVTSFLDSQSSWE